MSGNYTGRDNTSFPDDNLAQDPIFYISEAKYEEFAFITNIILSPCICLLGLIGNSLGLVVLWKDTRQQKLSIYTYLYCLTLFDSIYLFLGLIRNIPEVIKTYDDELANFVRENMKLGTIYLDMVFSHSSKAVMIVMSMERLIALVRPFTVRHFILSKYPRRVVLCCFLFNVIFLLPFPIYLEVVSFPSGNSTVYFVQFQKHVVDAMDRYMIVQTVIDYFVPASILFFTNIAIPLTYANIVKLRLTNLNIDPSAVNNQQKKITLTVFFITLLYLLCSLPNLFIKILAFYDKEYSFDGMHRLLFWFFIDLSNLFEQLNAANDSVIYILVSNHYRQIFKSVYCRGCYRDSVYAENDTVPQTNNMDITSESMSSGVRF